MTMHHWGSKSICVRLGWKAGSAGHMKTLILRYAIPAFPRVDPRNKFRRTYYMSESSATAWELANAMAYRERLKAAEEEKRGKS
jgi:hypothetical protein